MDNRWLFRILLAEVFLSLLALAPPAVAQGDALALQQQAIRRIDGFVDHFRKTGDRRSHAGDLAQAEAELVASNRIFAERGDWGALAFGLMKQGAVQRIEGNWQPAIALYLQSEEAAKRARSVAQQAESMAWRALAESSRGNHGAAGEAATQAVRLAESVKDKDLLFKTVQILGSVQIGQGNLIGAADSLDRALELAPALKDPLQPYFAYLDRSDVYLKTAEKCDFQRVFEPCYQALERARADLTRALAIAQKLGYPGLVRQSEGFLRDLDVRQALIKSQESWHQTIQKTTIFNPKKSGDALVTEKFVAPPDQMPPALVQKYQQWKQMEREAGGFADASDATNHYVEGLMNQMRGENNAALAAFLKALNVLERDRRGLKDEKSRGTLLENKIDFYYAPIQQLLEQHRHADAFDLLERSRSRGMADLLASRRVGLARPEEQKLYAESVTLRERIAASQSELFELVSASDRGKNTQRIAALQGQIRNLEVDEEKLVRRMAAEAPRLQKLVVSEPVSLKALQQSMREERYEVLQYLVLEHAVIVWHIAPDSVFVRNVFLPRTEVIAKVGALQQSLADRNAKFDQTTARELFLFLIQPAVTQIRSERLVIIPHEDLNYVPFQVFQDPADGRFLGDRFQISYAPSASVLLALKRGTGISGGRLLAVADPGITAAGPEVRSIAKLFPGRTKVVTDDLAREADVKAWMRDFDVIHLSVHGKFNASEPLLSYLHLAPGSGDDGKLTAAEMFGLPLEKSRIVVLSACETGRAEATHGNEILGMVRALLYAGAGTLVLSYWEVDSAATAQWMRGFYDAARSKPPAAAARAALSLVKSNPDYNHPYFWAAFMVVGR